MSELELTEDRQMTFALIFGVLFSLRLTTDYIDGLYPIIDGNNSNWVKNKAKGAEKACNTLKTVINREFQKTMDSHTKEVFNKAFDIQQDLVYSVLGLDPEHQDKVRDLILKLNNNEKV